ncbi:IS481 family transposase [Oleiagrimonas sp.]|jgi:transposase InsO family protein|uniref:IS481 family transposase n=1 Tax=Oleiagrimonas sp. TaxID=2010330 RepID=UPI00262E3C73|nr:IS481 family transposase [Oleiagrimonas sp.]MDA3914880.1 IS481 family transposase [Oleiagrimonas sp.]
MNMHKGARLTPFSRDLLVRRITEHGLRVEEAAHASGVSVPTAYKWLRRFREEGARGLANRSSRPHTCPHATGATKIVQAIEKRRARQTYQTIAATVGLAPSTVGRILRSAGLNRLTALEPAAPIQRYEHDAPGDLLHLDIKKLARFREPGHRVTGIPSKESRGIGWEYVHVAIDDHSRVAFSSIEPNEQAVSACKALLKALRYYRHLGVRFTRILTDNGSCYRSGLFKRLLRRLGITHKRTRPYTPRTNGKAERFIQTALREWAYARSYATSAQRAAHLNHWLHEYNWHRLHASLGYRPPITRIPLALNNVLGLHT